MGYPELLEEIKKEFPDFELIPKSTSFQMKVIDIFLKVITFWRMKDFMTRFITTTGQKTYTPTKWESWPLSSKVSILRHERVHMRQKRKYGGLWFSALYLFLPVPILLAYFRMKFEREAYTETLHAYADLYGVDSLSNKSMKEAVIRHFTSAEYFWMWPWRKGIERWFDDTVDSIRKSNK